MARTVVVTGGAGYVGSALVPALLEHGYNVRVLDLYLYGDVFAHVRPHAGLTEIHGDIRDRRTVDSAFEGSDAVLHLACISNDPSFELDPDLGKSINFDAFEYMVESAKDHGVKRFVYASSSSVYGVRDEADVNEDLELRPLTDYSKYKAMCEEVLMERRASGMSTLIVRPATVCGYAPRLRLDLTVNILTNHAVNNRAIRVFGGQQMRPNIHIGDMVDFYLNSLTWSDAQVDGKIYNAGYDNRKVMEIAQAVKTMVGPDVTINVESTNDNRSYHVSSEKIKRELGFEARLSIEDAVADLVNAFAAGKVPDPMTHPRYYNIKTMQNAGLR